MLAVTCWIPTRRSRWIPTRRSRCLLLLLCSPLLLPFLCATLPILCLAEFSISFFRRRRRFWRKEPPPEADAAEDDQLLRRCEEGLCGCGGGVDVGMLQRYLEDQLLLVRSAFDCGGDENLCTMNLNYRIDDDNNIINTPLLG